MPQRLTSAVKDYNMHRTKVRHLVPQALALTMALFLGLIAVGSNAQAADNYGYQSISYSGVTNPPTADKPQSKMWWNDGSWWADMWTTGTGWQIYRLDRATKTWVSTGVTNDNRSNASSDTLWDGNKLYIASHVVTVSGDGSPKASLSGQPAKLYRYSYASGKYTLDAGFPTNINNNSSESMTIDKDTTGVVWATWTQVSGSSTSGFTSRVYVNSSAPGGATWGTPFVLPVADPNPAPDDISAIVAFGSNKIGVMWSDAPAGTVYWATRTDGTSPTAASSWKVQSAIQGKGQADDHVNVKTLLADSAGRVYAAVKTSLNDSSSDKTLPQLQLLVFKPGTGSFTKSTIATVGDCVSRPQILLDTANNKVRAFYTAPSTSVSGCAYSGVSGSIYEKTASMDDPVFGSGRGTPVIQDGASANMNNVTTTKQGINASTGVVVLASNNVTKRYWFSDRPLGTAPAPSPSPTPTPTPTPTPAPTSETVTVTATADTYVSSGATGTNYGTSTVLGVDSSTEEISYLKFDLSAYAGRTLESAVLQLRSAGNGSAGKQNVKLVATDSWTEGGLTYGSRPALGTSIGTLGPTTASTNYSVPLTATGLAGELGQQLSLGMDSSSSDGLELSSKEAGSTVAPKLVLTLKK